MINKIILNGRLTKDWDLRYTQSSGKAIARNSIAVDRPFTKDKAKITDYFDLTVWGNFAETVTKFSKKGSPVVVEGRLQQNNYTDKEGNKRYSYDVLVSSLDFVGYNNKKGEDSPQTATVEEVENDYQPIEDGDIPF